MPGGWGVVFSALASPELEVSVKLRLNPTELRAAHAVINDMGAAGYNSADINAVCRAMFLYDTRHPKFFRVCTHGFQATHVSST